MKFSHHRGIASLLFASLLLLSALPALAGGDETRLRARLSGPRINSTDVDTPSGSADFRARPSQGRTHFSVELESTLTEGTSLQVTINGAPAGSMTVDAFGIAEIDENTNDGGMPPTGVAAGDVVVVRSSAGSAIASGIFRVK